MLSLDSLRTSTRDLHQQLDSQSLMPRLLSEDISCQEYADILGRLLICHVLLEAVIERSLSEAEPHISQWASPAIYKRSRDIRADLLVLGYPAPVTESEHLEGWGVQTPASIVGIIYVLAGSALGGQLIGRALQKHLPIAYKGATSFFLGPQSAGCPRWPELKRALGGALQSSADLDEAVGGARRTFAMFVSQLGSSPEIKESLEDQGAEERQRKGE